MSMHYFCTYFDINYLPRGLALYESIHRHVPEFVLDVLCLDERTHGILTAMQLPGVKLQRLVEFEAGDAELGRARRNRTWVEYLWTLTPTLIQRAIDRAPEHDVVTYLDADLFFYSSPTPIFEEFGTGSIMLIPHRFARLREKSERMNGIFNVGMMSFRRDERGLAALGWWRARCLEACHATHCDGKFGDQKYLDDWPVRFAGVCVIGNHGANLAPWNIAAYQITGAGGHLMVDDTPVIFYHFHNLDILRSGWFRCGMRVSRHNLRLVYRPYLGELMRAYQRIRTFEPDFSAGYVRVTLARVAQWCFRRRLAFMHHHP